MFGPVLPDRGIQACLLWSPYSQVNRPVCIGPVLPDRGIQACLLWSPYSQVNRPVCLDLCYLTGAFRLVDCGHPTARLIGPCVLDLCTIPDRGIQACLLWSPYSQVNRPVCLDLCYLTGAFRLVYCGHPTARLIGPCVWTCVSRPPSSHC